MTDQEIKDEIKRLRRCILVHSIIYYRMGTSVISDYQYDKFAKKLKKLQDENPKLSESVTDYYKDFKDWNGCSGFDLNLGDIWGYKTAEYLIKLVGGNNACK